jgi:hypothetical protein
MKATLESIEISDWALSELTRRISAAPSQEWADRYFDLIGKLIRTAGLTHDDRRLLTSMPVAYSSRPYHLPVSINNRYVLDNQRRKGKFRVRFIYVPHYDWRPDLQALATVVWRYQAQRGQWGEMPLYLQMRDEPPIPTILPEFDEGWLEAAYIEANRPVIYNPHRHRHQPVVYKAAMDLAFRARLLNKAFPQDET